MKKYTEQDMLGFGRYMNPHIDPMLEDIEYWEENLKIKKWKVRLLDKSISENHLFTDEFKGDKLFALSEIYKKYQEGFNYFWKAEDIISNFNKPGNKYEILCIIDENENKIFESKCDISQQ